MAGSIDLHPSMKRYTANYLWNFKPSETRSIPRTCIDLNERFTGPSNVVTPRDVEGLVGRFSKLEKMWDRIPHWVIKADLARLLYVYFNGGFYFDVDCVIRKGISIEPERFLILFTEKVLDDVNQLGPRECKNPENALRIANYAFGTNVLRHPFLNEAIMECIDRLESLIQNPGTRLTQQDILWVCGPDVMTTVYHRSRKEYPNLFLLDNTVLAHLCHGSWRE